jgi:outer membrane cobalamin receptor
MSASLGIRFPVVLVTALCACKSIQPGPIVNGEDRDRIFISQQMIERSGGQTAWEVLRREAPQLSYRENRDGQASSMRRRGESSINLNDSPMIIVDGVRSLDIRTLQQIPASVLRSIEILTGPEGTTYYGTDAVGGVIIIKTKNGSSD